jgi:hypothetical protein
MERTFAEEVVTEAAASPDPVTSLDHRFSVPPR